MKQVVATALVLLLTLFLLPLLLLGEEPLAGPSQPPAATGTLPIDRTVVTPGQTADGRVQVRVALGDGEVLTLPLDKYLWRVVAAEMPASFEPEALKAQTVAARTYTLSKMERTVEAHPDADVCTDITCCQAYIDPADAAANWGENAQTYTDKIAAAVADTDGMAALFQGQPIQAVFFSSAAGRTVDAVEVWGNAVPYLTSVDSPEGDEVPNYHSAVEVRAADFKTKFLAAHPEAVLEAAIAEGQLALEHTTEMNPVLKKAGVVDAGGKGFLVILQGMLDSLRGVPMPEGDSEGEAKVESKTDYAAIAAEEITFTFDTVFIVRKTSPHKGLEAFEAYLNSIGDSLVIGEDDDCFKVHVHTDIPGAALTEAQKYGTLELAKIENMRTQAEDLAAGRHIQSTDDLDAVEAELEGNHGARKIAPPEKKYGVVAVAAGDGLAAVFRDLGADGVISGGQTMNPSTDDILREIDATPAEVVFVLPNNKNIIMAAEQCVRLVEGKQVVVLPTKTIPQGISALMVMDPEAEVEDNRAAMAEAIGWVHTSEITYAARDSDFDGFAIKRGDYLALTEHQLFGTDRKLEKLLRRLAEAEAQQSAEFINIFYGEDVSEKEAQKALKLFTECCPNAEITLLSGGQPVYYYMISAE